MKIARAPYRVSLFGGSTDYPSYYSLYGSLLIGFTIDSYCYVCSRFIPPILIDKYIISYSKVERTQTVDDIQHDGCRGVLQYFNNIKGLELNLTGDLPARTGIGSSSSFIVACVYSLNTLLKRETTKKQLALDAIHIERNILKEPGGIQDQIWAAYGGMNSIEIKQNGDFFVKPLPVSEEFKQQLKKHLLLFYTGGQRQSFNLAKSHDIVNDYKSEIQAVAHSALEAFVQEDIIKIGRLLRQSWYLKKNITKDITSDNIDKTYNCALEHGAIGGKLLGSGTSGFMVFVVMDKMKEFIENMKKCNLQHIDYDFDNVGAKAIL